MARNGRVAKPFAKDGLFYVRRRVPQDLIEVIGKTHYLKSLGTGSASKAAECFPAANAATTTYFQQLRACTGSWPTLPSTRLTIIDSSIEQLIANAELVQRKMTNFVIIQSGSASTAEDDGHAALILSLSPETRSRVVAGLLDELEPLLPRGPLPVPVRLEVLKRLNDRLVDFAKAWDLGLKLARQQPRKFTPPRVEHDPNVTLEPLLKLWAEKKVTPCKSALDDAKSVVRDFTSLFGDIPVNSFTADDFDHFVGELPKLPAAMSRAERSLPFADRVKLGDKGGDELSDKPERRKVKDATTAKKLALLKAILAYAFKKKRIRYNLTQGLETGHKHEAEARRQMTSSEVTRLLSLPIFSAPSCWKYNQVLTDATIAWVGLIGLVSGSRLGEIAQAHIDDILEDEGHVAFSIRSEEDRLLPREVKTPGSQRVIVIHPLVASLGFLDYVAAVRASGSTLLFPDVAVEGGGLRSKEASRRLNQLVDEVIVRKEVTFYSLRHTFKARARIAGVSADIERQMTGHAAPDVSGQYGLAFISQLAAEMDKISFPMVPWDLIRKAWAGLNWTEIVRQNLSSRSNNAVD